MKKIFTLLTLLMCVVLGVNAQETVFDAGSSAWEGKTVTATVTVGDVTWYGRSGSAIASGSKTFSDETTWTARMKFGGGSTFKSGSLSGVFAYTPTSAGHVKVYCAGGGSGERTINISQSITSTNRDAETVIGSFKSTDQTIGIAEADVEANKTVYVWSADNVAVYGITFTPTAADAPKLSIAPTSLAFALYGEKTTQTEAITVTGENLAAGTYEVTLPSASGFTASPSSVSVGGDGKLNQTINITFSATSDVAMATGDVSLTISGKTAKASISYAAKINLVEQVAVSEETTWDWTALTANVQLTEETTPKRSENIVMANLAHLISFPAEFNAQAIVLSNTEYPSRAGKLQNGTIGFKTTTTGVITIDFSDTGSSGEGVERYIYVNGTKTSYYTKRDGTSSDRKVTGDIEIAAGDVSITSKNADGDAATAICVYKITFTPKDVTDPIPSVISEVKAAAEQDAPAYNLAGQKADAAFKGIVIKNGKKVLNK